jgi:prevent-host-death family protein
MVIMVMLGQNTGHDEQSGATIVPILNEFINIAEAKARLPELVERASQGETIIIARHGEPQARLVPLEPAPRRQPGLGAGQWTIIGDFDAPLPPEVQAAFEGRDE